MFKNKKILITGGTGSFGNAVASIFLYSDIEEIRIIEAPFTISVEPNVAHLLTALEDSLFLESFKTKYSAIEYLPYRNIVKKSMKQ